MKNLMILVLILGLGFALIYSWDKCPPIWIALVGIGVLFLFTAKRNVWVRGPWKPMNLKERLARDTTAPASAIKAIQERYALNEEAKLDDTEIPRMREIAKRLIFLDGYLAAKQQRA